MINIKQLEQFKEIYLKKFGIELSNKEAYEKGVKLLNLIRSLSIKSKVNVK